MKNNSVLSSNRNIYKLAEVALVIIGQSNDKWPLLKLLSEKTPDGFQDVFGKMIEDAKEEKGYVKSELEEYKDQYYMEYVLMTHDPDGIKNRTYEEWLSTETSKGEIRDWVKLRGYETSYFDDDDIEIESANMEKPLVERERKSLYRIIGALLETFDKKTDKEMELFKFKNQSALIEHLVKEYKGYEGLSTSKLTEVFPASKKALLDLT